jgi:hypothetical protein
MAVYPQYFDTETRLARPPGARCSGGTAASLDAPGINAFECTILIDASVQARVLQATHAGHAVLEEALHECMHQNPWVGSAAELYSILHFPNSDDHEAAVAHAVLVRLVR